MKDNQQIGQAIYKMSEGKRKQLFNHLLNEFRNSKVNLGPNQPAGGLQNTSTPNYLSGHGPVQLGVSMGMYNPQNNLSGSTPSSSIKHSKKKSSSIDKQKSQGTSGVGGNNQSTIIHTSNQALAGQNIQSFNMMNTDPIKKTGIPKKGVTHKKSKSYITGQTAGGNGMGQNNSMLQDPLTPASLASQTPSQLYSQQLYYQQMMRKGGMTDVNGNNVNGSTLENSFGQVVSGLGSNSVMMNNKSYERILAETIEAQNMSSNGLVPPGYLPTSYYQINNSQGMINQKLSSSSVNQHNMTLQLSSKRGNGSANISHTRINSDQYDSQITRDKSITGYQSNKSSHNSHKSLTNSKYDQQQRKKSRGNDQFQIVSHTGAQHGPQNNRSKIESNRSKKSSPHNNTINTSKGTINIREARTKPTSPERSYVLINSFKQGGPNGKGSSAGSNGGNNFVVAGNVVNQREERKALNMMSNIQHSQHQQMSSNQIGNGSHQPRMNNQDFISIQQQATSKRKNFKNMFYSPKGGRDAFTEPHSKFPSQAQTKEHSPAHKMMEIQQQLSQTGNQQQLLPQSINHSTTLGHHHPKIRASANKPPTQLKNKSSNLNNSGTALMYSTKDSNKRSKIMALSQIQDIEGAFQTNSFLEESYMKNATNNFNQMKREDISFDSSQNQFSQTGTPINFKVKLNAPSSQISQPSQLSNMSGAHQVIKKINIVGREVLNSQLVNHVPHNTNQSTAKPTPQGQMHQSNSTLERKPKKIMIANPGPTASALHQTPQQIIYHPHTTGINTKNNSQAPSPTNNKLQQIQQQPSPIKLQQQSNQNRPQGQQKKQRFMSEAPSPQNMKMINQLNSNGVSNLHLQEIPPHKKRGISIGGVPSSSNNFQNQQDSIESFKQTKKFSSNLLNPQSKQSSKLDQSQQQFLFNQYVKTKKPRHHLESNDVSLERQFQSSSQQHQQQQQQQNLSTNAISLIGTHQFQLQPLSQYQQQNQAQQDQFFDMPHNGKHVSASEVSPRSKEVNLIKELIRECFQKYNKPPKTQIELYKIGKMLGKGAFGRVNLGLHRLTRRLVAIKTINMEFMKDESSKKKMSNEISILKALRHPNVVKLLETFDTDKHHLIVMELCPGGDLLNYVRKRRKLNENMAKFVFKQIMEGIAYLHKNGVVHRDIKLDNILLDGHGHIKLADFGVSRKVSENNELLFEQCGTPAYIAPEIVRELGYKGYPVDIWSAGVCLYAMLYGNVPFKANQMGDLNKMILDATIEYKDTASEDARDLMMRMLQKNPNKRLTAEDVLDHQWFDEVDEQINIFDEQELDLIKKEFTYVCQKAKLKELRARQPDDLNTEFTEHSINSNENTLMKNNSSRSVILCPFNTQAGAAAKSIYEDVQHMMVDKDMAIRFNARVRELDRQYEKFNNKDFDNGVYHKYAYNQGKGQNANGDPDGLKEEVIDKDDVLNKNLVRRGGSKNRKLKPDIDAQNYYIQVDDKIVQQVEEYGFPKQYILKGLSDNVNNHCTTSYYLLCMDQNY